MYKRHISTPVDRRHLYEVILEGLPCHLYFDLEYSTAANPGLCGDTLVNRLVLLLLQEFRERWGILIKKQVGGCVTGCCGVGVGWAVVSAKRWVFRGTMHLVLPGRGGGCSPCVHVA